MEGGSFGNDNFSIAAPQNMFSKDEDAIASQFTDWAYFADPLKPKV